MSKSEDYILLKWRTLKGWSLHNSPKTHEAFHKYHSLGVSMGAAQQRDTPEQKQLICEMIDNLNGFVQNDWTGEVYENKEDAKKYVLNSQSNP